ncbi:PAS domain S-box protein [Natronosalvus rutilus]|uniref:histidine kinase n=1 Tax=Natronosalvus rutilus TaxID=2953753 RepID=A0A9E7NBW9_9EURY|nr:PAS domain S-box protein [Natronosalvus rutilus]UTF55065.1 PAS domain S-box protein [Natronosalvus rutilus]
MSDRSIGTRTTFWEGVSDDVARDRYRTLVDTVDDGLYQLDADGCFEAVNEAIVETTGFARDELVGEHISVLLEDEDVARGRREIRRQLEEGTADVSTMEFSIRTAEGGAVPCDVRMTVLIEDGEFAGTIGVARDVSERERHRERAESARETYRSITSVLDDAEIGVIVLDDEFTVAWADETIEEYFGLSRAALVGRDKRTVVDDVSQRVADSETFAERVLATYEDNDAVERFECRVTESGERTGRWLEHWSKPIETGQYAGGRVELYSDITEQKRSEGALLESEAEFASLVDAVEEYAIFRLDPEGRVASWNEGASKIKGYDREEIVGEHFSRFYTADDRAERVPERNLATALKRGSVEDEGWRVRCDGTTFWANVTITAVFDGDGTHRGFLKVTRDMTDRREHEQQLQHERDLITRVLETSPVGIMVANPDGTTVRANDRLAEIFDRSVETMEAYSAGQRDMYDATGEYIPLEDRPISRVFETGEAVTDTEIWIEDADGQPRWLSINAAPVTRDDGSVRHVVAAVTDITQLKVQAERIERQRDDLRTELDDLFERIDDAFFAVDTDWHVIYANEAFADLVDVSGPELLGAPIWDALPELEATACSDAAREAKRTGTTVEREVFYEPAGAWLQVTIYPSESGQSVYLTDITERVRSRNRLQRRAVQQEVIAGLGQFAIETNDIDELMHEATQQVADALEADYCKVLDLDSVADELRLRQGVGWQAGIMGTATVSATDNSQAGYTLVAEEPVVVDDLESETRFQGPDLLTDHDVSSSISTIVGSANDPWGILGVHDTSHRSFTDEDVNFVQSVANILAETIERTEYRAELEGTIDRLEDSNERLEQFAYAASHDLQEPLRMVSSYLQLIERRYGDDLDEDGEEFLEFAVDGADRMREMIDGLLQYSRIDTQGAPLEPVDAGEALEEALANLEVRVVETDAMITADPMPWVRADGSQLRQVFQNLLANALTYAGDAPPRVHVSAERDESDWTISVRDEGIGIEPRETDRIFDVFNRAHSREEDTGTGIGLAICQRVLERHGGKIWVDSEPGEGATFSFTLPAAADVGVGGGDGDGDVDE